MAFPFFPESHPAMSLENYIYMRQLCERRRAVHEQKNTEHIEQITSPSSAERSSFERASLRLQRSGSGSGSQDDRRPSRLARLLIPAGLRRTKSLENRNGPNDNDRHGDLVLCISPPSTATRPATSTGATPSTITTTPTTDPEKHIFHLYSALLTNPFSPRFELNPLLLNITQPLLSKHRSRRRNLRVLDLGGIEGNVYMQTLATLPHVAICQLPQPQLSTKFPPYLPFKSKSFDVITTRTLYKLLADPYRSRNSEPRSWVREIHRVLDNGGHFEFFFFDRHLSHAGPLTREMEPCLYQDHQSCGCSQIYEACTCSPAIPTSEAMTGAQFLELLSSEGFIMEKSTTLMFPFSFLSQIFTQDGQRLKVNQEDPRSGQSNVTPLLASLMKTIDEECRASQTAWRCIIGSAQKRKH